MNNFSLLLPSSHEDSLEWKSITSEPMNSESSVPVSCRFGLGSCVWVICILGFNYLQLSLLLFFILCVFPQ